MVPNLLSPRPFNAPLLRRQRLRVSSLSSPRREIGLMKLKGMKLSQHCGFQRHCFITPSRPPKLTLRPQVIKQRIKDRYLSHYISGYCCPFQSASAQTNRRETSQGRRSQGHALGASDSFEESYHSESDSVMKHSEFGGGDIDQCVFHLGVSRHFHAVTLWNAFSCYRRYWVWHLWECNGSPRRLLLVCMYDFVCVCMLVSVCVILIWSPCGVSFTASCPAFGQLHENVSVTEYSGLFWFQSCFRVCREMDMRKKRLTNTRGLHRFVCVDVCVPTKRIQLCLHLYLKWVQTIVQKV